MTPIIAVFMSLVSLLALVADRASLEEQTLSLQGEAIPLPGVDDTVAKSFLDVAKRTLPFKMTPSRAMTLRRVPRAATIIPAPSLVVLHGGDTREDGVLVESLLLRTLSKRDIREQLWGGRSAPSSPPSPRTATPTKRDQRPQPRVRPTNSLGELRDDLMMHGRDREQLRRRWKIENENNRVANIHG